MHLYPPSVIAVANSPDGLLPLSQEAIALHGQVAGEGDGTSVGNLNQRYRDLLLVFVGGGAG